jgi:hypothetical protein
MDDASRKESRVRMDPRDRQTINRIMDHNRALFKNAIKSGILRILNTQNEVVQLEAEHNEYSEYQTARNQHDKEQLQASSKQLKDTTSGAPMGGGAATGLLFSGVSSVGGAYYDREENKRQEARAKEKLYSAQMMHYVKADYEDIAERVASILSYRFQFLLFRLAAGSNGYIRLANFMVDAMEKYAVKNLRAYKGHEVKAFIDAAIPPPDSLMYLAWKQRKVLEQEPEIDTIMTRVGPAVRTLLGGYKQRVNSVTGNIEPYNPYTICGALNHAPILDCEGGVILGMETPHRGLEPLDGTKKYPMILLGLYEDSSDLGVNFATKLSGKAIQGAQVEALLRLVPDFFSHEVDYTVQPKTAKSTREVASAAREAAPVTNADLRYLNEWYEIPWTEKKNELWEARLQALYTAPITSIEDREIVTTNNYKKHTAMQRASYRFDAEQARKDVVRVTNEANKAQGAINETDIETAERVSMQHKAVIAAKYAALATSELMTCLQKCSLSDEADFELAVDIIEAARTALNASRGLPVEESRTRRMLLLAMKKTSEHVETVFNQQKLCRENLQMVSDFVRDFGGSLIESNFVLKVKILQSRIVDMLRKQVKESLIISKELAGLASALAYHGHVDGEAVEFGDALEDFKVAAAEVRAELVAVQPNSAIPLFIETIELCVLEAKKNYDNIRLSLEVDDFWLEENAAWVENLASLGLNRQQIKDKAIAEALLACTRAQDCLRDAKALIVGFSFWERNLSHYANKVKPDLEGRVQDAVEARDKSIAILKSVKLPAPAHADVVIDEDVNNSLALALAMKELGLLRFIKGKKDAASSEKTNPLKKTVKPSEQTTLQLKFESLEHKARLLNRAIKKAKADKADAANQEAITADGAINAQMSLQEISAQVKAIRLAVVKLKGAIADDIEIADASFDIVQLSVAETSHVSQEINAMDDELVSLQESCYSNDSASSKYAISSENLIYIFDRLSVVFSEEIPSVSSEQVITAQERKITAALLKLIQNCCNQLNEFSVSEQAVKEQILANIKVLKEQTPSNPIRVIDGWGVELLVSTVRSVMILAPEMDERMICQFRAREDEQNQTREFSGLKLAKEIIRLDRLAEAFMPTISSSALVLSGKEEAIKNVLLRLIDNCINSSVLAKFTRTALELKADVVLKIKYIKEQIAKGSISYADNWGVGLVVTMVRDLLQLVQNVGDGVEYQLTGMKGSLYAIKEIVNADNADLKAARDVAMTRIRKANWDISNTRRKQSEYAMQPDKNKLKWGLTSSTLCFAAVLSDAENRYLIDKLGVRPPVENSWLQNVLVNKSSSPPKVRQVRKGPQYRSFELIWYWSADKIDEQKLLLGRLRIYATQLKTCKKQLYDLDKYNLGYGQKRELAIDQMCAERERLAELVDLKINRLEGAKQELESMRIELGKHEVRTRFNAWKNKTDFNTSARIKAIKDARELVKKRNLLKEEAAQVVDPKRGDGSATDAKLKQTRNNKGGVKKTKLEREEELITIDELGESLTDLQEQLSNTIDFIEQSSQTGLERKASSYNFGGGSPRKGSPPSMRRQVSGDGSSDRSSNRQLFSPRRKQGMRKAGTGVLIEEVGSEDNLRNLDIV